MALISSVNPGHGTDACLHYTLNDIMLQMTQVFIFTYCSSVEASSPLTSAELYELFVNSNEL